MQLLEHFKELSLHLKNAQELKGLILQLAVQGKLTTKWRLDNTDVEPASVLLERIKAEKAQLIKEKRIKKEKPLPKITKDGIPFVLPESWTWCRLRDLVSLLGDGIHGTPQYTINGEYHFVNGNNLSDGVIKIKSNTKTVSKEEFQKYKRNLNERTILVSINGTIGNTAFYNNEKVMLGKSACYFNLLTNIDKEYIRQLIKSNYFRDYAFSSATGTTIKNVSLKTMRHFVVPVPPLEEQKAIVTVVNQLFAEVEQLEILTKERILLKEDFATSALQQLSTGDTEKEWEFLKEHFATFFTEKSTIKKLRDNILQLAIQGKLTYHWREENPNVEDASVLLERIKREKAQLVKDKKIKKEKPFPEIAKDETPCALPEGWVWCRLGAIIKISSGDGLTSANMDKNGKIPVYGGNGITGYHSKYNVDKPEIVIGRVGYYCGSIHLSEEKAWVTDNAFITRFSDSNIYRDFLFWLLKGTNLKEDENATAQPVISGRKVYPIVVGLPPLEEQKSIVGKVNTLLGLCDRLEQEIQTGKATQEDWMKSSLREVFE